MERRILSAFFCGFFQAGFSSMMRAGFGLTRSELPILKPPGTGQNLEEEP